MSKYIEAYETVCTDDWVDKDDPRRKSIIHEMRRVHKAKTLSLAVDVIAWWDVWPNPVAQSPREFVKKARKLMIKMGIK